METDMDYQPKYSTGDLLQQGFTRQEIEDMRSRIAGTEAKGGIDTEKSVGYQLYNRGQQLTGAAQSGLTDVQHRAGRGDQRGREPCRGCHQPGGGAAGAECPGRCGCHGQERGQGRKRRQGAGGRRGQVWRRMGHQQRGCG